MDSNGNGDLTDDPPATWTARHSKIRDRESTSYAGSASVQVSYGKESRAFGLILDLNGDGKFESKGESFDVRKPCNVGGKSYEVTGFTAIDGQFREVESSKTVEEIPVPPVLVVGGKPVAFEEKSTAGKTIRFPADYKGKLVMLGFWATWRGPCRAELPNLSQVYVKSRPKDFESLGVDLDSEDSLKKLAKFTEDNHMLWPQICDGKGWDAKLAQMYGVHGIPACWLIDGNTGLIVTNESELRGPRLLDTVERCLAKLGKAAAIEKGGPSTPAKPRIETPLVTRTLELANADKLLSADAFGVLVKAPKPVAIDLTPPATQSLSGRQIARRAALSYLRAGWVYQCTKCDRWHTNLAGGYALSKDTVVTAFHSPGSADNDEARHGSSRCGARR